MKVKLAVQVLSDTVASVLENVCLPECHGTAEYCKKLDSFFDCANVRSLDEFKNKRKPFLQPYKLINDSRFEWLFDFLVYLKQWQESISGREGPFSKEDKARMFISRQIYVGLKTTTYSLRPWVAAVITLICTSLGIMLMPLESNAAFVSQQETLVANTVD